MTQAAHDPGLAATTARPAFPSQAIRPGAAVQFTPAAAPPPPAPMPPVEKPRRLLSLDAYRGFIMIVLASGGLGFVEMARDNQEEVRLLAPLTDPAGIPTEGRSQIIVVSVKDVLHFRIFDAAGKVIVDSDETQLPWHTKQINQLRNDLQGFAPPHELTPSEKGRISAAVFAIFGQDRNDPGKPFWGFLAFQTDHVAWVGCSFWDLIQPSFMFMVGVAVPYSYVARKAKGQSEVVIWGHTLGRSVVLVLLGVFLTSNGRTATDWAFMNVLTQIGLGYPFVCALRGCGSRWQLGTVAAILVGTWLLFFFGPTPPAHLDPLLNGRPANWVEQQGWFAHWEKNANVGSTFDYWFLNLFPRSTKFTFNKEGYQTLNFIPSIATMLLGLMAGERLRRSDRPEAKFAWLVAAGAVCLVLGLLAGWFVCPLVKRIWTPSWVLFSSGWTFLFLAAFFGVVDLLRYQRWAFPLIVVGVNSIAMYLMGQLMKGWVRGTLVTHFGPVFDNTLAPVLKATAIMVVLWLICLWMYRRGLFLKV
jgi:heparan-alpha-glucosaminide N-acetyltransferase